MASAPPDPWHRRDYGYRNRPYTGCGCLSALALILVFWWLLSWLFFPPYWFYPAY